MTSTSQQLQNKINKPYLPQDLYIFRNIYAGAEGFPTSLYKYNFSSKLLLQIPFLNSADNAPRENINVMKNVIAYVRKRAEGYHLNFFDLHSYETIHLLQDQERINLHVADRQRQLLLVVSKPRGQEHQLLHLISATHKKILQTYELKLADCAPVAICYEAERQTLWILNTNAELETYTLTLPSKRQERELVAASTTTEKKELSMNVRVKVMWRVYKRSKLLLAKQDGVNKLVVFTPSVIMVIDTASAIVENKLNKNAVQSMTYNTENSFHSSPSIMYNNTTESFVILTDSGDVLNTKDFKTMLPYFDKEVYKTFIMSPSSIAFMDPSSNDVLVGAGSEVHCFKFNPTAPASLTTSEAEHFKFVTLPLTEEQMVEKTEAYITSMQLVYEDELQFTTRAYAKVLLSKNFTDVQIAFSDK